MNIVKTNKCNINGVLLLDKPTHISSNAALQRLKHLFNARKAGHTGSLDPLASGMLPICFGEATKLAQFLLDTDKRYQTVIQLGIKTTTGDAEGEIIEQKPVPSLDNEKIEKVLSTFRGEIHQIPSMYSALKYKGQPLYKLARAGISVERKKRLVKIYSLTLVKYTATQLELNVHCSKGAYIRTLAEDIGDTIGCGAHVIALRRQTVGQYKESQMISLPILEKLAKKQDIIELKKNLLPLESMVIHYPKLQITEAMLYYMRHGNPIIVPHAPANGWCRLYSKTDEFVGVGEILPDGKVAPRRLI